MDIKDFSNILFENGKTTGFSDMEIYYVNSNNFEVTSFNNEVDTYKVNTDIGLSFRGIFDGKMGYAYTEKFEQEEINFLIDNALQNARETQPDSKVKIFEGSSNYKTLENMELCDAPISKKIEDALEMEKCALNNDKRIQSVQYCLVETANGTRRIINTKGLDKSDCTGFAVAYLSVVAKQNDETKSSDKFKISNDYGKINFKDIVKECCSEAISKFNASPVSTGKYKVILRYDAVASMLATFSSIFSADSVQKGLSLLKGKVGQDIASSAVSVTDNPLNPEGPSKCSFDDEGVATFEKDIIDKGILKTFLYDLKTATKDKAESTGNGFKPSYKSPVIVSPTNMYIKPGMKDFNTAVREQEKALIITELQGLHAGANPVSGDFSLAAEGYLVENGAITKPVEQITIAGNFYSLLKDIEEVLSDFEFSIPSGMGSFGSPSIIIKELSVSGK